jgi:hypothetical protein
MEASELTWRVSKAFKKALALEVLFLLLTIAGCTKSQHPETVCPIDAQPAQWTGARNGNSCEYSHYSIVERKTHSWWAACAGDGAK